MARAWYAARDAALGQRFLAEYDRAIGRLAEHPHRWPVHPRFTAYRRLRLGRFPYSLIYELVLGTTHVLAVAADRRRPGYWRRRTL